MIKLPQTDPSKTQWLLPAQAVIGHKFLDETVLITALTHPSRNDSSVNYERLEFLGDRVLGLVLTDYLVRHFPHADQGELTKRYHDLSNEAALAQICQRLGLQKFIMHAPAQNDLIDRESVQSDIIESVIAALYLDGGLNTAQTFILANWTIPERLPAQTISNPKSELQEWAAAKKIDRPSYHLLEQAGSEHEPLFTIAARIAGIGESVAAGGSRKQAERSAARRFLHRFVHKDEGLTKT